MKSHSRKNRKRSFSATGALPSLSSSLNNSSTAQLVPTAPPSRSGLPLGLRRQWVGTNTTANTAAVAPASTIYTTTPRALPRADSMPQQVLPVGATALAPLGAGQRARQPNRTTRTNQKLVLFPADAEPTQLDPIAAPATLPVTAMYTKPDETNSASLISPRQWLMRHPTVMAQDPNSLRRVSAYCTAAAYQLSELREYIESRRTSLDVHTKRVDEVLHAPFFPGLIASYHGPFVHTPEQDAHMEHLQNEWQYQQQQLFEQQRLTERLMAQQMERKMNENAAALHHEQQASMTNATVPNSSDSSVHQDLPTAIDQQPEPQVAHQDHSTSDSDPSDEASPDERSRTTTRKRHQLQMFTEDATGDEEMHPSHDPEPVENVHEHDPSLSPKHTSFIPFEQGDIFFFDYGVVVFWGLTDYQERALLYELQSFQLEPLESDDYEVELLRYRIDPEAPPRIFDDCITLRTGGYMRKLTISHAIAQSVKLSVFETRIESTITSTQVIPQQMAVTGKVQLSKKAITRKIGQLFVLRINVNLVSNVLDTPEIFWSEPKLESLYKAARGYLEISQRVEVLNQRTNVISDLLDMLKDHLTSTHGEFLEWIVIILIALEIVIGVVHIAMAVQQHK